MATDVVFHWLTLPVLNGLFPPSLAFLGLPFTSEEPGSGEAFKIRASSPDSVPWVLVGWHSCSNHLRSGQTISCCWRNRWGLALLEEALGLASPAVSTWLEAGSAYLRGVITWETGSASAPVPSWQEGLLVGIPGCTRPRAVEGSTLVCVTQPLSQQPDHPHNILLKKQVEGPSLEPAGPGWGSTQSCVQGTQHCLSPAGRRSCPARALTPGLSHLFSSCHGGGGEGGGGARQGGWRERYGGGWEKGRREARGWEQPTL